MKMRLPGGFFPCLVLACVLLVSCRGEYDYFITAGGGLQHDLEDLFSLMEKYSSSERSRERFVIIKQVIDIFTNTEMEEKKILFLTYMAEKYPGDPFNAYYLAVVAQTYRRRGEPLFSGYYYKKAVSECEDLFFAGEYIHKYCLQELAALAGSAEEKILFYSELLRRFRNAINPGEVAFFLARSYEQTGEYDRAVEMYREFLNFPAVSLAGFPDAYSRVKEKLLLYEHKPDWVLQDLNDLVTHIRRAIGDKDTEALAAYRAKDSFFTLTWEQKKEESLPIPTEVSIVDYISAFLLNSDVVVAPSLDIDSSAREAYLRTDNWAFRVHPTWYFYFRKLEYGPDPDINGGWEWAGIYFGEKL